MDNFHDIYMNRLHRNSSFRMPESHTHLSFELYYLLSGTQKFFIQHTVYSMKPFDLALIVPGTLHRTSYYQPSTHERILVIFEPSCVEAIMDSFSSIIKENFTRNPILTIPESMRNDVGRLFTRLFMEYEKKDEFSHYLLPHYLGELLMLLTRFRRSEKEPSFVSPPSKSSQDQAIERAAYYISQNYGQCITLENAAGIANLSSTYFSKKFKEVTGFGFKEYLNSIRLQKASELLMNTENSITEIAFLCGFESSNYFGDLFYKSNGLSPRSWRKQQNSHIK